MEKQHAQWYFVSSWEFCTGKYNSTAKQCRRTIDTFSAVKLICHGNSHLSFCNHSLGRNNNCVEMRLDPFLLLCGGRPWGEELRFGGWILWNHRNRYAIPNIADGMPVVINGSAQGLALMTATVPGG